MAEEWKTVDGIGELKRLAEEYGGEAKYEWEEFRFERATTDAPGNPDAHAEFLVLYEGNHVETFSLDRMSAKKIRQRLEEIRDVDPSSMDEWLGR